MKYVDIRDMSEADTWKQPIAQLFALVKCLNRNHWAKYWVAANGGPTSVHRLCVAIKLRCYIEKTAVPPYVLACMIRLDPPPCRCGRKGTRVIGRITFCMKCGPPVEARRVSQVMRALNDGRSAAVEASRQAYVRTSTRRLPTRERAW